MSGGMDIEAQMEGVLWPCCKNVHVHNILMKSSTTKQFKWAFAIAPRSIRSEGNSL